jgi:hypothetical protein
VRKAHAVAAQQVMERPRSSPEGHSPTRASKCGAKRKHDAAKRLAQILHSSFFIPSVMLLADFCQNGKYEIFFVAKICHFSLFLTIFHCGISLAYTFGKQEILDFYFIISINSIKNR